MLILRHFLWLWVILLWSGQAFAAPVTVRLKSGTSQDLLVASLGPRSLKYRLEGSLTEAELSYDQIETIDWPEPEDWKRAEAALLSEKFPEAVVAYGKVISAGGNLTFYPAQGNFRSRARRALLECHRALLDAKSIEAQLKALQPELALLPEKERSLSPVFMAWAAAGGARWEEVIRLAATAFAAESFQADAGEGIEMAYLQGVALREQGQTEDAAVAFGSAYTLNAGGDPRLSAMALRASLELAGNAPGAHPEIIPQSRIFSSLYGKGALYAGAPQAAVDALAGKLDLGESALGHFERSRRLDDGTESTTGLKAVQQITADRMKKIVPESELKPAVPQEAPVPEK